ncbi:hypothetical protein BD769DRAFT_1466995 [Suillus cothurnatus]|nr:hypothetical protein BD769DRAFT_1466995 [Suillus cothurnatus]
MHGIDSSGRGCDVEVPGGDRDEILRNERMNSRITPSYLLSLTAATIAKNVSV